MSEKRPWNGECRRKDDAYLNAIEKKVDRVFDVLRGEFGDEDLNGEKIEGRTTKNLRLLNEKVAIQNGRVKKLEDRNIFLDGAVKTVGIICFSIVSVLTIVVMWIRK